MDWGDLPTGDWMAIIRDGRDVSSDFAEIIGVCNRLLPDGRWAHLAPESVDRDVSRMRAWMVSQLPTGAPIGIYLGLDTLNMENDPIAEPHMAAPKNLEIGWTTVCDVRELDSEWAYELEKYGSDHLIESLRRMKRLYETWPDDLSYLADYAAFLCYSGLLLRDVFRTSVTVDHLAIWGFHDGDMYWLSQRIAGEARMICELAES